VPSLAEILVGQNSLRKHIPRACVIRLLQSHESQIQARPCGGRAMAGFACISQAVFGESLCQRQVTTSEDDDSLLDAGLGRTAQISELLVDTRALHVSSSSIFVFPTRGEHTTQHVRANRFSATIAGRATLRERFLEQPLR
jgi:hypothetical protein